MTPTKDLLLAEAEALLRTRGYAAFSYADLSTRVGIRKASIHHHFATKEELGGVLIDNYLVRFEDALKEILAQESEAKIRLGRYAHFFVTSMIDGMLPLCGALSAEMAVLPQSIQERVNRFFRLHLDWVEAVIRAGVTAKELRADVDPGTTAMLILSTLEGASFVAWAIDDASQIAPAVGQLIASLERPETSRS
jgi:TetR/AcrR family transcriptional regulator, transcriptional repressor for nem operon